MIPMRRSEPQKMKQSLVDHDAMSRATLKDWINLLSDPNVSDSEKLEIRKRLKQYRKYRAKSEAETIQKLNGHQKGGEV